MYHYEIKTLLNKLISYRKNLFNKFKKFSDTNIKNDKELNILIDDINKITYSEDFLLKLKKIYEKKLI
jgi:hypothetical protein